jgi:8-oxo-dGTP diphosphatase
MTRQRPSSAPTPGYDAGAFPAFAVTVDVVILTIVAEHLMVLLVRRGNAPYRGAWALPGGFKHVDEDLETAAERELLEETGIPRSETPRLRQLKAYGDPGRDRRGNVVTVAFTVVVPRITHLAAGTDAEETGLWPVSEVMEGALELAFDHGRIIEDAVAETSAGLENSDLATAFVQHPFTLSELRTVFEAVWGTRIDPANFRRSLLTGDGDWVRPTGQVATAPNTRGRPAELFLPTDLWRHGPPLRHPDRGRRGAGGK